MSDNYQTLAFRDLSDPVDALARAEAELDALGLTGRRMPEEEAHFKAWRYWQLGEGILAHCPEADWAKWGEVILFGETGYSAEDIPMLEMAWCPICEMHFDLKAGSAMAGALLAAAKAGVDVTCAECGQAWEARGWTFKPDIFAPDLKIDFANVPEFPQHWPDAPNIWKTDIVAQMEAAVGATATYQITRI